MPAPKKTLPTSKSMEGIDTKNSRPSSYILQPVASEMKATNAAPRSRFTTNNLNCCKGCSQENDMDAMVRGNLRKVETVTMPKLQQNRPVSDMKYQKPEGKKSSMIPASLPSRESMNSSGIFRKMSLRKPSEIDNRFTDSDFRRQSLDDSATNGKRLTKTLSSIEHSHIGDQQRMHSYTTATDKFEANRKMSSMLGNNKKQQVVSDDHLKSLESKIRKHRIDAMRNAKEYSYGPIQPKPSAMLNGVNSNAKFIQTKLDQFTSNKKRLKEQADRMNGSFQNMGIDSVLRNNAKTQSRSAAIGGHSYGIISASDLYKLRAPTESII